VLEELPEELPDKREDTESSAADDVEGDVGYW
jgi:hypothetical protein